MEKKKGSNRYSSNPLHKGSELFSNNPRIIAKIRALLIAGQKYTAKQLNAVCGFNDSRKAISVFEKGGNNE